MKTVQLFTLIIAISFNVAFAQEYAGEKSKLAFARTKVVPIKDTKNGRQYELYIRLPEKYAEKTDVKHPVIYYTDAVWHVEMLSGSTEYILENAILVGISWQKDGDEKLKKEAGAHVSRYRDYSIAKSKKAAHQAKYQFGQASNHLAFIRNDVIRYVERNYRTDPANRTYYGYSLGGGFGGYILLTAPDTFKNYILGSPSKGSTPHLTRLLSSDAQKRKPFPNTNVFISYGKQEKTLGERADKFIALLKNHKSVSLKHITVEGTHSTAFPMTTVRGIYWLSDLLKNK
ncbi:hydrolase [marine bacterium AO1-C]|nr:hydrolase [marine bacterium AO1-C]